MKLMKLFLSVLLLLGLPIGARAQFAFTTNNGAITITGYTGNPITLNIPDTTNGYPVTSIGFNAFESCTTLTSVIIPNTVTNIGAGAFYACGLTNITIPSSVSSVGNGSFELCTHLASITIGATNIGGWVFYECTSLTVVTFSNSVQSIGDLAFEGCSALTSLNFLGNAPSLGGVSVFSGDSARVSYLPGTTNWGATFGGLATGLWYPPGPFNYTTNGNTVKITGYTGSGGAVIIPGTINAWPVTSIGEQAFEDCTNLTSVTVLDGVKNIETVAFFGCTSLTNVLLPNTITNIDCNSFGGCTRLANFTVPDGVVNIGEDTFGGCTDLTNVMIANSVTSISDGAFSLCTNLRSIVIDAGITNIGESAFAYCSGLKGIYFQGNAPTVIPGYTFAYTSANVYYLPGTTGWSAFATNAGIATTLWLPAMQTGTSNSGSQTNLFGFNINWASGKTVVVDACVNLSNPDWWPVATNTLTTGSFYFSDPEWTKYPVRYYRLRSP